MNIRLGAKGLECSDLLLSEIDFITIKGYILDEAFTDLGSLISFSLHLDVLGFGLI